MVQGITADRFGVGYSGIGYVTSGVRIVPLSKKEGGDYKAGSLENVLNGSYPLGRFLYLYINSTGKPLDPMGMSFADISFPKRDKKL